MVRFKEDRWDLELRGLRVGGVEGRDEAVRVAAPPFVLELSKDCLLSKGTPRSLGAAPLALGDAVDVLQTLVGGRIRSPSRPGTCAWSSETGATSRRRGATTPSADPPTGP